MNILHTEEMGVCGGQGMRVIEDLKIIRELGFTPFLACKPVEWLYQQAVKENLDVVTVPFSHNADMKSLYELYKFIRENKIDIVHTHSSIDSYIATAAAKLAGVKVVRSRHIELTKRPGLIYKSADAIVTTGEKIKETFGEYGFKNKTIVSIPSYPETSKFFFRQEIKEQLEKKYKTENKLVIGTLSGMNKRKRAILLLEVLPDIIREYPNLKLIVAGQDNHQQKKNFEMMVKKYALEQHVEYVGYVVPREFLNILDIYVCPSRAEGVPQALMQAMMMEVAAISTDVGSVRDLNIEQNLIIVQKDDTDALKSELLRLVKDEVFRKELGVKNAKVMRKYCSRDVMKQKMKVLYESL